MTTPPGITIDHLRAALARIASDLEDAQTHGLGSPRGWYAVDRLGAIAEMAAAVVAGDVAGVERLAPAADWLCRHPETHATTVHGVPVRVCLSCSAILPPERPD